MSLERAQQYFASSKPSVNYDPAPLLDEGYSVWPDAVRLLAQVSGITIKLGRWGDSDPIWFDPAEAAQTMAYKERVDDYMDRVGARLIPIGGHSHLTLMACEDGRIFGGFDDLLVRLGDSVLEAVNSLATNAKTEEF